MTVEIKQCDTDLAIALCRLTGWRGVADRLEQGWEPMPDTNAALCSNCTKGARASCENA